MQTTATPLVTSYYFELHESTYTQDFSYNTVCIWTA